MIIHQPEIKIEGNEVLVSTRIEMKGNYSIPKELWFKYPLEYQDAVTDRSDGFFASLFLLGMHFNEGIEIRGVVSPKIIKNSSVLRSKYLQHAPKYLNQVDFNFISEKPTEPNRNRDIRLSSFSGGVDSFYSFWSHFYPEKSAHPVSLTHGLFIHGYDLVLENQENYQQFLKEYQTLFADWGLSLIQCSTNAYSFYRLRTPWIFSNTPTLVGAVLGLCNGASFFNQPGNYDPDPIDPSLASSNISLFSTETTDFFAHGVELERSEKINAMRDWYPIQKHMRVCMKMDMNSGMLGCQKCQKCLNTSLMLNLMDIQEDFLNYKKKFTWINFLQLCWKSLDIGSFPRRDYFKLMYSKKRYDLILLYWIFLPINLLRVFYHKKIIPILPKRLVYFVKSLVFPQRAEN